MNPRSASLLLCVLFSAPAALSAAPDYAPPHFADSGRRERLTALLPEIDREFRDAAARRNYPGLVWGLVLDGELVHTGATGFAHLERRLPAGPDTRFRIASMTKSFTALAVLKLRDAGRLALDDRLEKFLPEFRAVPPLTADAPAITLRHLLTMTAGFPQDDPWGDRQLALPPAGLQALVRGGLSASTPAGTGYEYSNLGYALLGHVISTVAGEPYQRYITREILQPLGMHATGWEFADVPADRLALGYRRTTDGRDWQLEPLLADGTFGAMGGLITTLRDFARYAALHLAAWPARDAPEAGPVLRATIREMHRPAIFARFDAAARTPAGEPAPAVSAYGFGLRVTFDHAQNLNVGHSGGLPGFGSHWMIFPEHGFGVISFANLTYAGTAPINAKVAALLLEKAGLPRRTVPPSPVLARRHRQVAELIQTWEPALADAILAENFFLDRPRDDWRRLARTTLDRAGAVRSIGDLTPENQLRGRFALVGERGRVDVSFTLTPEREPRVQELRLAFVPAP
jgi:CubicO group peptidase (beta-lactamase class C family)